jgi:hypothetical protein
MMETWKGTTPGMKGSGTTPTPRVEPFSKPAEGNIKKP